MRVRLNAVNSVFTGASNEIGECRAGIMAALIGTVPAAIVGGVGVIGIAAIFYKVLPSLWNVQRMSREV